MPLIPPHLLFPSFSCFVSLHLLLQSLTWADSQTLRKKSGWLKGMLHLQGAQAFVWLSLGAGKPSSTFSFPSPVSGLVQCPSGMIMTGWGGEGEWNTVQGRGTVAV